MTPVVIVVIAVLFIATIIRSALGFGEALIAVPLLATVIPVSVAVPVAVLVSITVALVVVVRDWRLIHLRSAAHLLAATLVGAPVGLLLLAKSPPEVTKVVLGAMIVALSAYFISRPRRLALGNDRHAWVFGLAAGVLGGAYGMNGPPLVIYGLLRGWTPAHFRATLQGYFLPASVAGMIGYWLLGLWTSTVTAYYVAALPAVLLAIVLGRWLSARVDVRGFTLAVHVALIAIGIILMLQAAWTTGAPPRSSAERDGTAAAQKLWPGQEAPAVVDGLRQRALLVDR